MNRSVSPLLPKNKLSTARTLVVPAQITRCAARIFAAFSSVDMKSLGMQRLAAHRLKRAESHVQRDICDLRAGLAAFIQNVAGEMQTRRRRGHRSGFARKHRLVSLSIRQPYRSA